MHPTRRMPLGIKSLGLTAAHASVISACKLPCRLRTYSCGQPWACRANAPLMPCCSLHRHRCLGPAAAMRFIGITCLAHIAPTPARAGEILKQEPRGGRPSSSPRHPKRRSPRSPSNIPPGEEGERSSTWFTSSKLPLQLVERTSSTLHASARCSRLIQPGLDISKPFSHKRRERGGSLPEQKSVAAPATASKQLSKASSTSASSSKSSQQAKVGRRRERTHPERKRNSLSQMLQRRGRKGQRDSNPFKSSYLFFQQLKSSRHRLDVGLHRGPQGEQVSPHLGKNLGVLILLISYTSWSPSLAISEGLRVSSPLLKKARMNSEL